MRAPEERHEMKYLCVRAHAYVCVREKDRDTERVSRLCLQTESLKAKKMKVDDTKKSPPITLDSRT